MKAEEIEGWMDSPELEWLRDQAKDKRLIIEIGSWKGRSSMAIFEGMPSDAVLYCVDTWLGSGNEREAHKEARDKADPIYSAFVANHQAAIAAGRIKPMRGRSHVVLNSLRFLGLKFDMIFIDADHSYKAVKTDIEQSKLILAKGGILCGHDYGLDLHKDGGVEKAVLAHGGYKVGAGSIWRL